MDTVTISDPLRAMITATRQQDGRIVLRAANRFIMLTDSEVDRLAKYARGLGSIQRHKGIEDAP